MRALLLGAIAALLGFGACGGTSGDFTNGQTVSCGAGTHECCSSGGLVCVPLATSCTLPASSCGAADAAAAPSDAGGALDDDATACIDCHGGDGGSETSADAAQVVPPVDASGDACPANPVDLSACDQNGLSCPFPIRGGCTCEEGEAGLAWVCFYPP
jgi:cytochrome c553